MKTDMDTVTDVIITYGQGGKFKTLRAAGEGNFTFERRDPLRWGESRHLRTVVLTQTDLFEAIELWIKENS